MSELIEAKPKADEKVLEPQTFVITLRCEEYYLRKFMARYSGDYGIKLMSVTRE